MRKSTQSEDCGSTILSLIGWLVLAFTIGIFATLGVFLLFLSHDTACHE